MANTSISENKLTPSYEIKPWYTRHKGELLAAGWITALAAVIIGACVIAIYADVCNKLDPSQFQVQYYDPVDFSSRYEQLTLRLWVGAALITMGIASAALILTRVIQDVSKKQRKQFMLTLAIITALGIGVGLIGGAILARASMPDVGRFYDGLYKIKLFDGTLSTGHPYYGGDWIEASSLYPSILQPYKVKMFLIGYATSSLSIGCLVAQASLKREPALPDVFEEKFFEL